MRVVGNGATHLNQDISNWDVSNVKDMKFMFIRSYLANNNLIPDWYENGERKVESRKVNNSYINKMRERTAFKEDIKNLKNLLNN